MKEKCGKVKIKIKGDGGDDWLGFRGTSFGRLQSSQEPRPKFRQTVSLRKDKTNVFSHQKRLRNEWTKK